MYCEPAFSACLRSLGSLFLVEDWSCRRKDKTISLSFQQQSKRSSKVESESFFDQIKHTYRKVYRREWRRVLCTESVLGLWGFQCYYCYYARRCCSYCWFRPHTFNALAALIHKRLNHTTIYDVKSVILIFYYTFATCFYSKERIRILWLVW